MKFDIAIVNYNTDFHLLSALTSIRRTLPAGSFGLCHVWDNGSTDRSRAVLDALGREVDWLRAHLAPGNLHHGPALDRLLRDHCRADWVLVLDSDTRVRHDFRAALPPLEDERPAFIGQVHPEPRELYAYMCHLLVNRAWYLELPPFDRDGAPGRAFFRAIEERGIHWRRFRWVDHVDHLGQATLHALLQRRETAHPLYRFAAAQEREDPRWAPARAAERPLRRNLESFLAERGVARAETDESESPTAEVSPAGLLPAADLPASPVRRPPRWDRIPFPASRVVRIAAAFGLGPRRTEIGQLFRLVRHLRPHTVLELGLSRGGTFFLWTRAAAGRATLVSTGPPPWEIDDPGEDARWRAMTAFGRPGQRLHLLRDDPLTATARTGVDALLAGRPLDFLFLTGEDDVERVRRGLALYGPLVRPGGLVALDGIRPRLGGNDGLSRLWHELAASARGRELVEDASLAGGGIGVVRIEPETPPTWWRP